MRIAAVLLALALAACASRDGMMSESFHDCDSGGPVSVDVVLNAPGVAMENVEDQLTLYVAVGNNGHSDIEVMAIRVEPNTSDQPRYALGRSYRKFDRVLAPGEDETFELPVTGRGLSRGTDVNRTGDELLGVNVSVYLAGGDTYQCQVQVPSPR